MAVAPRDTPSSTILHATCVALDNKGLLITGPSGSGKSSLALNLMAFGAQLVADDGVQLEVVGGKIRATSPSEIAGKIEARGVGLINVDRFEYVFVDVLVNLAKTEEDRLPKHHFEDILGVSIPCYYQSKNQAFPAALLQLLKAGRFA